VKNRSGLITPTEAKRNLQALDILSSKTTLPNICSRSVVSNNLNKSNKKATQSEAKIQTELFKWAASSSGKYPELKLMFHVPNGGSRNAIEAANLKRQGVKAGVPDICLPVARSGFHGLYLELKSDGGRLQDTQKTWLDDLNKQGYKAVTVYGFDEAKAAIENYLCKITKDWR
jgi:hypothetical protein